MYLRLKIKFFILFLGMLLAGTNSMKGREVTINLSEQGYANAEKIGTNSITVDDVTMSFTDGSTPTAYYTNGSAVRIYGGGSVTLSLSDTEKPITQIVFTFASSYAPSSSDATCNGGSITYGATTIWTGSSNSVSLTRAKGSGHWRLQKVVVTYTDVVIPPEPSIDTVDGIAGVRALASGTEARLHWTDAMNARVLYSNDELTFVRDESGTNGKAMALCRRGVNEVANNPLHSNQHLSGWVIGKYTMENNMPVFDCTDDTNTDSLAIAEPVTETRVMPTEIASSQIDDYRADYVTLKDLRVSISGTDTLVFQQDDEEKHFFLCNRILKDQHFTEGYDGATVDVTGMVWADEDGLKLAPVYVNDNVPIVYVFDQNGDCVLPSSDIQGATVRFKRTISSAFFNTLCLPVDWEIDDAEAYVFGSIGKDGSNEHAINVAFQKSTTTIAAGTPFITKPMETIDCPVFYYTTLHASEPQPVTMDDAYSFSGTYSPIDLNTETDLFLGAGDQFYYPSTTGFRMPGLRAYLTVPAGTLVKSSLNPVDEGLTDEILLITDKKMFKDERIYSLSGQFLGVGLEGLDNGIYIINNKKYLLK